MSTKPIIANNATDNSDPTAEPAVRHDVHIVLGSKGGIGKSWVASALIQWARGDGRGGPRSKYVPAVDVLGFDTDPLNPTLSAFKHLGVRYVSALDSKTDQINAAGLDDLIERACNHTAGPVVVDVGSAGFVAMANYLLSGDIAAVMHDTGKRLVLHAVVTGGQAREDTLNGMRALAEQFPASIPLVVWVNEWDQPFAYKQGDVLIDFETCPDYLAQKDRIHGVMRLLRPSQLHRAAIDEMLRVHATFVEITGQTTSHLATMMSRQRVRQVQLALFAQIDRVMADV